MQRATYVVLAAVVLIATAVVSFKAPQARAAANPIHINHCFITEPKPLSKNASGTQISYVNTGTKNAKSVTFGVGYRNAESKFYRKVTDVGTIAPGVPIDHHFGLYKDVTYAGKQTTSCEALKVVWVDGTVWTP